MSNKVLIESKFGNLENFDFEDDIRWSTTFYGQTLLSKIKKLIFQKFNINGKNNITSSDLFLQEAHHQSYGRPWITGKYQLDFMKSLGLETQHKLLDFGCGSGRFGIRAINYLDNSNYFGLDFHLPSLQAFAKYELVLNDLINKAPRLLKDDKFDFGYFGIEFNWIIDFYVSHHLDEANFQNICKNANDTLVIGGKYVMSPPKEIMKNYMLDNGFVVDLVTKQQCDILKYHGYEDFNEWIVFKKVS